MIIVRNNHYMRKNCFTQTKVVGWRHFLFVKLVSPMQAGSISSDVKIAANAAIAILIQAKSRQKYKKIMFKLQYISLHQVIYHTSAVKYVIMALK
jgi:hypothetical protein